MMTLMEAVGIGKVVLPAVALALALATMSMRKIREVLRLRLGQGLPQRAVAQTLRLSQGAVHGYIARARRAGLGWPLSDGIVAVVTRKNQPVAPDAGRAKPDRRRERRTPGLKSRRQAMIGTGRSCIRRASGRCARVLACFAALRGVRSRAGVVATTPLGRITGPALM